MTQLLQTLTYSETNLPIIFFFFLQSLQLITGLMRTCDYNFQNRLVKTHMLTLWECTAEELLGRAFFLSFCLIMKTMESFLALCLVP